MASFASQLSSRRLARTEARVPALAQPNAELKRLVYELIDRDEAFANRLRTFVDEHVAPTAAPAAAVPEVETLKAESEAQEVLKAEADVKAQEANKQCSFAFLSADYLRGLPEDAPPLPPFQQLLRDAPNAIVWRTIDEGRAYRGGYTEGFLAVSHRWERPEAPDTEGVQQRAVCAHLRAHRSIKEVWLDSWCMWQGERSGAQRVRFKHMLKNVNLVYLGMRVLVLADISYLSRFWTQFEAWLSMRQGSAAGLGAAHESRRRVTICCLHNATQGNEDAKLRQMWERVSSDEAHALLSKPDVTVTNQGDKEMQLDKVKTLNAAVRDAWSASSAAALRAAGTAAAELPVGFAEEALREAGYSELELGKRAWKLMGDVDPAVRMDARNTLKGLDATQRSELAKVMGGWPVAALSDDQEAGVDLADSEATSAFWVKNDLKVYGGSPPPFLTFEAADLPPPMMGAIAKAGYEMPSVIQAQTWPAAMAMRDVIVVAKTGSGKALGFLVPGFLSVRGRGPNPQMGPSILVLAPTREVAMQINDVATEFGQPLGIRSACCYGGAPKGSQMAEIRSGCECVIGTPGRLNDFYEAGQLHLEQVSYLVMDEADRMLDMGFEPQIRKIICNGVPPTRQTLFYTATWPRNVRSLAEEFLRFPVQVEVGDINQLIPYKNITQYVHVIRSHGDKQQSDKQQLMSQIFASLPMGSRVLVFASTKFMCDYLGVQLQRQVGVGVIHGDKDQREREQVLSDFKSGHQPVIIATDVSVRGIDLEARGIDVAAVINYDFPSGIEDYIHRICRTGRAGAKGIAHTFMNGGDESKYAHALCDIMSRTGQALPRELASMAGKQLRDGEELDMHTVLMPAPDGGMISQAAKAHEILDAVLKLEDSSASVRKAAMLTLGKLESAALLSPQHTEVLKQAVLGEVAKLEDSDEDVREAAVETLGVLESAVLAQHAAAIVAKLEHSDGGVCRAAMRALGKLESAALAQHVVDIIAKLEDEDVDVREVAVEVLGKLESAALLSPQHAEMLRAAQKRIE